MPFKVTRTKRLVLRRANLRLRYLQKTIPMKHALVLRNASIDCQKVHKFMIESFRNDSESGLLIRSQDPDIENLLGRNLRNRITEKDATNLTRARKGIEPQGNQI